MSEMKYPELRGLIRTKWGTQEKCAEAIGLSQTSLSEKLNEKSSFKPREIAKFRDELKLSPTQVNDIFLQVD